MGLGNSSHLNWAQRIDLIIVGVAKIVKKVFSQSSNGIDHPVFFSSSALASNSRCYLEQVTQELRQNSSLQFFLGCLVSKDFFTPADRRDPYNDESV